MSYLVDYAEKISNCLDEFMELDRFTKELEVEKLEDPH